VTADDLEDHLREIGLSVSRSEDVQGLEYTVVKGFVVPTGGLQGHECDVAIQRVLTVPYVPPPAIHTRPHLVSMDGTDPVKTMASSLGDDWQYWSRRYDREATPRGFWAHVITVLGDERWIPC